MAVTRMVRKQLYIEQWHDARLKRLARAGGRTQADVVREAVERYGCEPEIRVAPDPGAWDEALAFMRALQKPCRARRRPAALPRDVIYEEGLARRGSRPR